MEEQDTKSAEPATINTSRRGGSPAPCTDMEMDELVLNRLLGANIIGLLKSVRAIMIATASS